jgi:glycosyltransferase involved in cell wall biosynthesis
LVTALQLGMHWFPERAGGLDRAYYELSRALPLAGMDFHGLVAGTERAEIESNGNIRAFAPAGAPLARRWYGMRRAFRQQLTSSKPEIIVSHFPLYAVPVLDMLAQRPFVAHFHGPWADEGALHGDRRAHHALKHLVESLVYRRASRAIVLSQAFAAILASEYRVPRARIHVVPGGIDTARFRRPGTRDEAKLRLGWPQDRLIIVAVRRLVSRMGLAGLVAAIGEVRNKIPDILLLIAGRGPLHGQLEAQIAQLGLARHVRLIGFVPDAVLPDVYRAAELSVVPSLALEGFGLVAAESLAAGTPCLVSGVGGLPEVVAGLSRGLILPSVAPADIADTIIAALKSNLVLPSPQLCAAYAAHNFDWRIIAPQIVDIYRLAMA